MTDERLVLVLHLQRKRDYLEGLASKIEELRSIDDLSRLKEEIGKLPNDIRQQIRSFDRLTDIEQNVSQVTSRLMRALSREYPDLTRTELVVCSYLRAGLTPGQAAELMFVSRRAVEKHRQSVRAKIGLDADIDMSLWLHDYEQELIEES